VRPALAGARGLFLLPGYPGLPDLLAEARRAGVEQVVPPSDGSAASGDPGNAITRYMVASGRALRESGLPWTFLRPSAFMSNTLQWSARRRRPRPVRRRPRRERGSVWRRRRAGAVHQPTDPEALLPAERLRVLTRVLGRDVRLEAQPEDEARAEMHGHSRPERRHRARPGPPIRPRSRR
jgi:uncharacterized protein YbjT (DUF2867 family)